MDILRQYIRESIELEEEAKQVQWGDDAESQAEKEHIEKVQDYLARKEAGLTKPWEKAPSKYKKKRWFGRK